MKKLLFGMALLALSACGKDDDDKAVTTVTSPLDGTYAQACTGNADDGYSNSELRVANGQFVMLINLSSQADCSEPHGAEELSYGVTMTASTIAGKSAYTIDLKQV